MSSLARTADPKPLPDPGDWSRRRALLAESDRLWVPDLAHRGGVAV